MTRNPEPGIDLDSLAMPGRLFTLNLKMEDVVAVAYYYGASALAS